MQLPVINLTNVHLFFQLFFSHCQEVQKSNIAYSMQTQMSRSSVLSIYNTVGEQHLDDVQHLLDSEVCNFGTLCYPIKQLEQKPYNLKSQERKKNVSSSSNSTHYDSLSIRT